MAAYPNSRAGLAAERAQKNTPLRAGTVYFLCD